MPRSEVDPYSEYREPPKMPPRVNLDTFGFVGQASNGHHKEFAYYDRKCSLIEICSPWFFNAAREFGLRTWDTIDVTYGSDPREAKEVRLRVIECPLAHDSAVKVAKGSIVEFTPVEHGVEQAEDAA